MTYPCSVYVMSMLILSCSKDLHPVLRKSHQTSEILRIVIIDATCAQATTSSGVDPRMPIGMQIYIIYVMCKKNIY